MPRLWTVLSLLLTLALVGCDGSGESPADDDDTSPADDDDDDFECGDAEPVGLLDDAGILPYPSMHLMVEDAGTPTGRRLAFADDSLPVAAGGSPMDMDRLNRLDGFSVANTSVVLLPDADIDKGCLPSMNDLGSSMDPASSVQIIDLDSGERIPTFAELDAHPDCTGPENRTLLIRPMKAMAFATHHAVVLTSALVDTAGDTVPTPERFAALRDGGDVHPGLCERIDDYEALFTQLEALAEPVAREDLVLAWDFHTGSEETVHAPLDVIIEAGLTALPADPAHDPDYTVDWVEDVDDGHNLNPHVWRIAEGSYNLPNYLDDNGDGDFDLNEEGLPRPQGDDDAYFMALVPVSVRDADPGTVPVLIFGHGIFSEPDNYLAEIDDPQDAVALADRLGMIFIATKWRGLSSDDFLSAVTVANDFGQFHVIPDKVVQGVANAVALPRLVKTRFTEAEFLQADDGSGSLVDTDRIYYAGISLGGIEGATLVANSDILEYGVFHVGGAIWSTMLERSSNWEYLDTFVCEAVPAPDERQILYAVTQLLWDTIDPITHAHGLTDKSVLWQESMGDEQVPNMTTEAMTRTVGVPALDPIVELPYGMVAQEAPLGPHSSALMQFDPQLGRPPEENRPAPVTNAHYYPRHTDEAHAQIEVFFTEGAEGTIMHPCGDVPCIY
jgi:hypothetical protein